MIRRTLLSALLISSSYWAMGAGYQLNLQGLRQLAMGGGGTAIPWDASTIFYNPGGLSSLGSWQINASALFIMPNVEYAQLPTGSYTATSQSQVFYPFNFYAGGPLKKGSKWGLGLGVYTPFGSGLKWANDWTGRFMVQSINLQSVFIQPTISYKFNDYISLGAGYIYAIGSLDLTQALPLQDQNGTEGAAELKGNASGMGYNIGLHIKANDKLQFGFTYRSRVDMKISSGNATFTVPTSMASLFPNCNFSSTLPLPEVASVGLGYKVNEKLTLQMDLNFVGWSAYDSLKFNFSQHTANLADEHFPRFYHNTVAVRLGANYDVNKNLSLMVGGAYDPSPVTDGYVSPELPDADRWVFTCGLAYRPIPKLCIMAACEFVSSIKRDASYDIMNFQGTYQTKAVTPGIGLSYNF
jgi:long-chain fatty acid transport protein